MTHTYHVSLNWKNERIGALYSPELVKGFEVATPANFHKGVPGIWSPEHLFTAAVSSCYMTTFLAIAENSNLEFESFSCDAKGILDQVEGKFLMTGIELFPVLKIKDEQLMEKAIRILQKTASACLISNSVKADVTIHPEINIMSLAHLN